MSSFITSSIGKKFFMSLTGLFLISFLLVHLSLNLLLVVDDSGDLFNMGAHFMATNPIIKVIEPILALGFIIHMIWGGILTLQNMKARPKKYSKTSQAGNCTYPSRNMFFLGGTIFVFLVIHLINFWWKIKFAGHDLLAEVSVDGEMMENTYALVSTLFKTSILYCIIYVIGAVFLGLHLSHGFWSAFQTIGFCNQLWRRRLERVSYFFAVIIALGFSIIPLYFIFKF